MSHSLIAGFGALTIQASPTHCSEPNGGQPFNVDYLEGVGQLEEGQTLHVRRPVRMCRRLPKVRLYRGYYFICS